jgi:predicted ATPase
MVTQQMDAELRTANAHIVFVSLLQAIVDLYPAAVFIEDGHWMDSASWNFTRIVLDKVTKPFLFMMSCRPLIETHPCYEHCKQLQQSPAGKSMEIITLDTLTYGQSTELMVQILHGEVSPPLTKMIWERAEGNPFFTEQLLVSMQVISL